jgi:hypothetical protein
MKTARKITMLIMIISIVATFGCTKEGKEGPPGPTGTTGSKGDSGPQAKTFNFNLTFDPGETYESYGGITGFNTDDVLLVYIYWADYGEPFYVQLPFAENNNGISFYAEFSEVSGYIFVNTIWANGNSGSPWSTSTTLGFKAVLISSAARLANPNIDYTNYNEVKKVFNLKD